MIGEKDNFCFLMTTNKSHLKEVCQVKFVFSQLKVIVVTVVVVGKE